MTFTKASALVCSTLLALSLAGCNNANTKPDSASATTPRAYSGPAVTIASSIPFSKDSNATEAVRKECLLDMNLSELIEESAKSRGIEVIRGTAVPQSEGRVLVMEITHVLATAGGYWTGPKSATVDGKLYDNGKLIGSFTAERHSLGGGYATCAMLNNCINAISSDITEFLTKPAMNAKLGDASSK